MWLEEKGISKMETTHIPRPRNNTLGERYRQQCLDYASHRRTWQEIDNRPTAAHQCVFYPTREFLARGCQEQCIKLCRHCNAENETCSHVAGKGPVTWEARIKRHSDICDLWQGSPKRGPGRCSVNHKSEMQLGTSWNWTSFLLETITRTRSGRHHPIGKARELPRKSCRRGSWEIPPSPKWGSRSNQCREHQLPWFS